jgi:hypothetical protein
MDDADQKKTRPSRRARAGRPRSEFSQPVADLLVDIMTSGNHLSTAIKAVGLTSKVVARWRKQNPEFDGRLERAEAQCETKMIALVSDAAPGDWRAALALAKSRWPERWSDRRADTVANQAAKLFEVNINFVTPEIIEQEKRRIATQRQLDEATGSAGSIETSSRPVAIEESQEEPPPGEPRH